MQNWHCKIGRVRPRLSLYRNDNVLEVDYADEAGFIERLVGEVRHAGVRGYSVIVTHDDGSATCGSKIVRLGSDMQMVGAVAYELVRLCDRIKGG
jgi:hypothetical protein